MGQPEGLVTIYGLKDPRTGMVRYVGASGRPLNRRLVAHICSAKKPIRKQRALHLWIRSLLRLGERPVITSLEREVNDWRARETYWIRRYRKSLLNVSDTATGKGRKQTRQERKAHQIARNRYFEQNPEATGLISKSLMGHSLSTRTRKKISMAHSGKRLSRKHRLAISNGLIRYNKG